MLKRQRKRHGYMCMHTGTRNGKRIQKCSRPACASSEALSVCKHCKASTANGRDEVARFATFRNSGIVLEYWFLRFSAFLFEKKDPLNYLALIKFDCYKNLKLKLTGYWFYCLVLSFLWLGFESLLTAKERPQSPRTPLRFKIGAF